MFTGINVFAQKFATHAVKEGETLESIAKQYKVNEQDIINYNKEIKRGQAIKLNTILVIPVVADAGTNLPSQDKGDRVTALLENVKGTESELQRREPIGFISHKTKRKETLYGISKEYQVPEEDIKRYNRELYSVQLKKGMTLRIPKYRKETIVENVYNEENYGIYTVQPKETRWSIAHKFGITIDSLLRLNPTLSKTTDHLSDGQELLLPKIPGSSIEGQTTQLYQSYTVPPKQTFYSLERKFGLTAEELMTLNPEIKARGGLKEGMVLRIPVKSGDTESVNTENYNFYEVKPKQTEFSLTRKLGVTYRELLDLNPDLKEGLKAGMVLKIPKDRTGNFDVKNALILDKINLLDSINPLYRPKLIFLLPFRLDRLDIKDTVATKNAIEKRKDVSYSLGLYSGAMVAIDSVAKLGISVEVKTFDTQLSMARTREILKRENLNGVSAIFGPLEPESLKEVAMQASAYSVPVIAPLTEGSNLSLNNVFFALPSEKVMQEDMMAYALGKRTNENIIIIADSKNKPTESELLKKFPGAKTVVLQEDRTVRIDQITALFSPIVENWVFLETDQSNVVHHVASLLNSLISKERNIRLFTTDKNRAFDNAVVSYSHLSNLRFTYPSPSREIMDDGFARSYRNRFGSDPDVYAVRGFDLTYDLLLKIAYKNDLIGASKLIGETEYTGNKFDFVKNTSSGYFNQASYIMGYENMQLVEIKE